MTNSILVLALFPNLSHSCFKNLQRFLKTCLTPRRLPLNLGHRQKMRQGLSFLWSFNVVSSLKHKWIEKHIETCSVWAMLDWMRGSAVFRFGSTWFNNSTIVIFRQLFQLVRKTSHWQAVKRQTSRRRSSRNSRKQTSTVTFSDRGLFSKEIPSKDEAEIFWFFECLVLPHESWAKVGFPEWKKCLTGLVIDWSRVFLAISLAYLEMAPLTLACFCFRLQLRERMLRMFLRVFAVFGSRWFVDFAPEVQLDSDSTLLAPPARLLIIAAQKRLAKMRWP